MSALSSDPLSRCWISRCIVDLHLSTYSWNQEEHNVEILKTIGQRWTSLSSYLNKFLASEHRFCILNLPRLDYIFVVAAFLAAFTTLSCSYLYLRRRSTSMLITTILSLIATALLSAPHVLAVDKPTNPDISLKLKQSLTHADFWNALSDDDLVFDFAKSSPAPFSGSGSVLNANVATWPLLMNGHQAVSQLNFRPCAMLAPHMHPGATKLAVVVLGTLHTYMRVDSAAVDHQTWLTAGKSTVFPRGAMHTMVNEGCTNAQAYAFFDSPDPGVLHAAQALWSAGEDVVTAIMPMIQVNELGDWNTTGMKIPGWGAGSNEGGEACKRRCGLL